MYFQSHFSDDSSDHNPDTTFEHMNNFIHWMYNNILFVKDGIIYNTTDVCSKQYICDHLLWTLSVLGFTYRGVIYRYINYPENGRIKIYGTN